VDALEHSGAGKPAKHTPREVLQRAAFQRDQRKILKPGEQATHTDNDNIGEKVNQ